VVESDATEIEQPDTCTSALDHVLDLIQQHPELEEALADPEESEYSIVSEPVIEECGDPEEIIEEMTPR
jgi:hypothetical protein